MNKTKTMSKSWVPITFIIISIIFSVALITDYMYSKNPIVSYFNNGNNIGAVCIILVTLLIILFVYYKQTNNILIAYSKPESDENKKLTNAFLKIIVFVGGELFVLLLLNIIVLLSLMVLYTPMINGGWVAADVFISENPNIYLYALFIPTVILSISLENLITKFLNPDYKKFKETYEKYADLTLLATVLIAFCSITGNLNLANTQHFGEEFFDYIFQFTLTTFAIKHGILSFKRSVVKNLDKF